MASNAALSVGPSPAVLCVSDSRESIMKIRTAVASYRPTETIETTTDPTVVTELAAVWCLDCVVVDADMQPVDGFELRSSLRTVAPNLSVIIVSTDSTAHETVDVVAADTPEDTALRGCLKQVNRQHDADRAIEQPSSWLARLTDAESRCELQRELEYLLDAFASVAAHRLWLADVDGVLAPSTECESNHEAVPLVVREAVTTGEPQHAIDPVDLPSRDRPAGVQTIVYPLGEQGAVVVDLVTFTPAVAAKLERLTTVAGACFDYLTAIETLEGRFRQTAERNRQLSQFARTVAHDLNSPLSVIYGRIELALADQSAAEMHLQAARNAAQRVDSLVTDHLQRIETADAESDREAVSVQTVAIQAWRIIDPSTARLQVEPQLETVKANEIRLQQLFENLIRNAIEHGSSESVGLGSTDAQDPHAVFDDDTDSVTVTIKPTDCGFAVCDDGPGIPPDERETIFESGYTTTDSGSGLGLHIVSEIIDSHGWEIRVTESASGGARFEVDTR